uniref:Uncharacterized protein n=1 Tax=Phlebotomus papatasi TaxID=29031 RepID=A0A1B0D203_PHLPP
MSGDHQTTAIWGRVCCKSIGANRKNRFGGSEERDWNVLVRNVMLRRRQLQITASLPLSLGLYPSQCSLALGTRAERERETYSCLRADTTI